MGPDDLDVDSDVVPAKGEGSRTGNHTIFLSNELVRLAIYRGVGERMGLVWIRGGVWVRGVGYGSSQYEYLKL